jgi:mono/diheme cytochrome c family protein
MPGGWDAAAGATQPEPMPVEPATAIFQLRCAKCHDHDGRGSGERGAMPELPDFTNSRWQKQRTTAQLTVAILEGKGKRMPAFNGRVSKEEARALARHVQSLGAGGSTAAPDAVEAPVDEFQARFQELNEEFERLRKQFHELRSAKP